MFNHLWKMSFMLNCREKCNDEQIFNIRRYLVRWISDFSAQYQLPVRVWHVISYIFKIEIDDEKKTNLNDIWIYKYISISIQREISSSCDSLDYYYFHIKTRF